MYEYIKVYDKVVYEYIKVYAEVVYEYIKVYDKVVYELWILWPCCLKNRKCVKKHKRQERFILI